MVGLGNGRRGGRSPPLLVAAMVACVIVLAFNYWISNSRNTELQNHVNDLEVKVRRAAAERSAVELKKNAFIEQLESYRKQIEEIQSRHNLQMSNVEKMWNYQMEELKKNISMSASIIQKLQGDFRELEENCAKLNNDITQCHKQMREEKQRYEETNKESLENKKRAQGSEDQVIKETVLKMDEKSNQNDKSQDANLKENVEVQAQVASAMKKEETKPTELAVKKDSPAEKQEQSETKKGSPEVAVIPDKLSDAPGMNDLVQNVELEEGLEEMKKEATKTPIGKSLERPVDNAIDEEEIVQEDEIEEGEQPFPNDLELLQSDLEAADMAAREEADAGNVEDVRVEDEKANNPEVAPNDDQADKGPEEAKVVGDEKQKDDAKNQASNVQKNDEDMEREDLMQEEEFNREQEIKHTAVEENVKDAGQNDEPADYNGDEGNVAESEADKQAALNGENVEVKDANNQVEDEEEDEAAFEKVIIELSVLH